MNNSYDCELFIHFIFKCFVHKVLLELILIFGMHSAQCTYKLKEGGIKMWNLKPTKSHRIYGKLQKNILHREIYSNQSFAELLWNNNSYKIQIQLTTKNWKILFVKTSHARPMFVSLFHKSLATQYKQNTIIFLNQLH